MASFPGTSQQQQPPPPGAPNSGGFNFATSVVNQELDIIDNSGPEPVYNSLKTTALFLYAVGILAELPESKQLSVLNEAAHFVTKQCPKAEIVRGYYFSTDNEDLAYQGNPFLIVL